MSNNLSAPNGPGRPKDPAKRRAILDAAKTLFLSHGYANTSMDAVAAEAGVSKLTVYSHFNDKETLFSSAVMAKCEEQLPPLFFELPAGIPVENVLLNIARGFHQLINSDESVNLHRLMMALGSQDPKLSQIFFDAGPERMVQGMERLLKRIDETGVLSIDLPRNAAEHFFCLLKGAGIFVCCIAAVSR
jgi:TetR/AcrR family transcriptional repressor of mexJK operon